jgi:predicted RNase H-like HicB family nuclease
LRILKVTGGRATPLLQRHHKDIDLFEDAESLQRQERSSFGRNVPAFLIPQRILQGRNPRKTEPLRYSMYRQWSEEDQAYIVAVPEFSGCRTHGKTSVEAMKQGQDAIVSWIEANKAWGRPLPVPRSDASMRQKRALAHAFIRGLSHGRSGGVFWKTSTRSSKQAVAAKLVGTRREKPGGSGWGSLVLAATEGAVRLLRPLPAKWSRPK